MAGGHNSILHSEDDDLIAYDDFSAIFQMILRILSIIRTSTYICMCFYSKSLRNMLINRVWSVRKSTAIKIKDDLVIVQEYICSSVVYIDRKDY